MRQPGLRVTMLVPLLAALALGSTALGFFVYRSVARDQLRTVDGEVARVLAASPRDLGNPEGPPRLPANGAADLEAPFRFVIDADGQVIGRPSGSEVIGDTELVDAIAAGGTSSIEGEPRYRVGSQKAPDGTTLVAALSLRTVDDSLASLRRNLLLGGAVLVVVQALVVALVARKVADPVVRLSGVAHRIASGDFTADVGRPSGPRETAALSTDLTAMLARLLQAIDERRRAAADAEQARADMERFMADASHELRTPLTAIRGYSDLYLAGMLDADGLERAMSRIGDESVRLASLVRDLLQLMQPADPDQRRPVDLAALASAVVHDLRAAHPSHPISHELAAGPGCVVGGDAARLHQALLNLGANACQHTPAGTEVVIAVNSGEGEVVVDVADRGPGVGADLAERIFQPFTRGEASRSRSTHDGAGLGLALADRIVRQHEGTIAVGETPGGGATFRIRLPTAAADTPAPTISDPALAAGAG